MVKLRNMKLDVARSPNHKPTALKPLGRTFVVQNISNPQADCLPIVHAPPSPTSSFDDGDKIDDDEPLDNVVQSKPPRFFRRRMIPEFESRTELSKMSAQSRRRSPNLSQCKQRKFLIEPRSSVKPQDHQQYLKQLELNKKRAEQRLSLILSPVAPNVRQSLDEIVEYSTAPPLKTKFQRLRTLNS